MQDTAGEAGMSSWVMLSYGRAKAGRPARTYIQQLYKDMGCSSEDLAEAVIGRIGERWSGISVLVARQDDDDDIWFEFRVSFKISCRIRSKKNLVHPTGYPIAEGKERFNLLTDF